MAYELRFDFQIDQQQLDGLSPQEIFILGFVFSTLYHLFNHEPTAFAMFVRAANSARIRAHARQIAQLRARLLE